VVSLRELLEEVTVDAVVGDWRSVVGRLDQ
jgi:hypothetical protein